MKTTRHVRIRREEQWPPPQLRGVRVLVVEDDAEEREFLVALLGAAGADVRSASSANEALATLAWWRPGVLVSDIGLPGGDGYDLMEAIRALPGAARVPAAAVTGQSAPEDRRRALRAGFQAHLAKPVDPDRLLDVIAGLAGTAAPAAVQQRSG
jgi:CheY-like chemotaxis protein